MALAHDNLLKAACSPKIRNLIYSLRATVSHLILSGILNEQPFDRSAIVPKKAEEVALLVMKKLGSRTSCLATP
jgi:hypothetical protein